MLFDRDEALFVLATGLGICLFVWLEIELAFSLMR
jgi:hypothetical protein